MTLAARLRLSTWAFSLSAALGAVVVAPPALAAVTPAGLKKALEVIVAVEEATGIIKAIVSHDGYVLAIAKIDKRIRVRKTQTFVNAITRRAGLEQAGGEIFQCDDAIVEGEVVAGCDAWAWAHSNPEVFGTDIALTAGHAHKLHNHKTGFLAYAKADHEESLDAESPLQSLGSATTTDVDINVDVNLALDAEADGIDFLFVRVTDLPGDGLSPDLPPEIHDELGDLGAVSAFPQTISNTYFEMTVLLDGSKPSNEALTVTSFSPDLGTDFIDPSGWTFTSKPDGGFIVEGSFTDVVATVSVTLGETRSYSVETFKQGIAGSPSVPALSAVALATLAVILMAAGVRGAMARRPLA